MPPSIPKSSPPTPTAADKSHYPCNKPPPLSTAITISRGNHFCSTCIVCLSHVQKKLCAICPLVSSPAARSDASPNKVPMAGLKNTPSLQLFGFDCGLPFFLHAMECHGVFHPSLRFIPEEGVESSGEDGLPPLQRGAPRRREGLPHRPAPLQLLQGGPLQGGEHGAFTLPPHPGFLFHLFNFCHCHWYSCSLVQSVSLSLPIY